MGLADYVLWDDDIDAHDGPIRGRLDVLQLSAVSDILARRISVLRKARRVFGESARWSSLAMKIAAWKPEFTHF